MFTGFAMRPESVIMLWKELLEEYDEVSAEKLLQKLLADLKLAPSQELAKRDMESNGKKQGFHSSIGGDK